MLTCLVEPTATEAAATVLAADSNNDWRTPIAKLQDTEARKEYDKRAKRARGASECRKWDIERLQ
eukprot:9471756-Prorocentrum_lima.AAC.1